MDPPYAPLRMLLIKMQLNERMRNLVGLQSIDEVLKDSPGGPTNLGLGGPVLRTRYAPTIANYWLDVWVDLYLYLETEDRHHILLVKFFFFLVVLVCGRLRVAAFKELSTLG